MFFVCSGVCFPVRVLLCFLVSFLDKIYGVLSSRSHMRLVAPVRGEPSLSRGLGDMLRVVLHMSTLRTGVPCLCPADPTAAWVGGGVMVRVYTLLSK